MKAKTNTAVRRYTRKQLFVRKLLPSFIITAIIGTLISALAVNFLLSSVLDTGAVSSTISRGYLQGRGDTAAQLMVNIASENIEFISFYAAVYDTDGNAIITPREDAILTVRMTKDQKIADQYELAEGYADAIKPLREYDDENGVFFFRAKRFAIKDNEFIPFEVAVGNNADSKEIKRLTLVSDACPEGYTEYTDEDVASSSMFYNGIFEPGPEKDMLDREARAAAGSNRTIRADDYVVTIVVTERDGEEILVGEIVRVDMQYIIGYAAVIMLPVVIVFTLLAAFISASKKYAELSALYAMDDYRKDMTNKLAHDLKSPLMVISGYAENLQSGTNPEKQSHYADSILENVRYMDDMIGSILELSKAESADITVSRSKVDVYRLCEEIADKYSDAVNKSLIEMTVCGNAELNTDRELLYTVLDNLVSNAVKYTDNGGHISISVDSSAVTVENECTGIEMSDPKELVKPFVKGDGSRSGRKGSGLGLAIASQSAEKLGYRLDISVKKDMLTARIVF